MPGNASRDEVIRRWIEKSPRAARTPPCSRGRAAQGTPPCFLYVWQGKDLQEGEFVCVAAKGVTGGFCGCVAGKGVRNGLEVRCAEVTRAENVFARNGRKGGRSGPECDDHGLVYCMGTSLQLA